MRIKIQRYFLKIGMIIFAISMCWNHASISVNAEPSSVNEVTIIPSYRHPVSGAVADSGGEGSYATGQGMVEGAVSKDGIIEETQDGTYYLTFTMSLIDFSNEHTFSVQETLESEWKDVQPEIVGTGSDENGTTKEFKLQIPEQKSIVRCTMYVVPMGRNVTFFITAGEYAGVDVSESMDDKTEEQAENEEVDGVTFSTKETEVDGFDKESVDNNPVDINRILYVILGALVCAIVGVLSWNYKIRKQKVEQDKLWENDDEV